MEKNPRGLWVVWRRHGGKWWQFFGFGCVCLSIFVVGCGCCVSLGLDFWFGWNVGYVVK